MAFFALMTKEMRLRMRQERTVWVMLIYVALLGLIGWLIIRSTDSSAVSVQSLARSGVSLYTWLASLQIFLCILITPAFTASSVNGERDRQTFELLICSRLTSWSLVLGKLIPGLVNACLLILVSLPLFSLVFFFGGVGPDRILLALLINIITVCFVGIIGIVCSSFFKKPAASTAVAYLLVLFWLLGPILVLFSYLIPNASHVNVNVVLAIVSIDPFVALMNTFPSIDSYSILSVPHIDTWMLDGITIVPWIAYSVITVILSALGILLAFWLCRIKQLQK